MFLIFGVIRQFTVPYSYYHLTSTVLVVVLVTFYTLFKGLPEAEHCCFHNDVGNIDADPKVSDGSFSWPIVSFSSTTSWAMLAP